MWQAPVGEESKCLHRSPPINIFPASDHTESGEAARDAITARSNMERCHMEAQGSFLRSLLR